MFLAPLKPWRHPLGFQKMFESAKGFGCSDIPFGRVFIALAVPEEILDDGVLRATVVRITRGKAGIALLAKKHQPGRASIYKSANRWPAGIRIKPDFAEMRIGNFWQVISQAAKACHFVRFSVDIQFHRFQLSGQQYNRLGFICRALI